MDDGDVAVEKLPRRRRPSLEHTIEELGLERRDQEARLPPIDAIETIPSAARTRAIASQDRRAAKDWNKLVDKLREGKFGEARRKLSEFERKFGEHDETKSLREQLEALPEDEPEHRGPGRHPKHEDD